jgi:hypothetical protein
MLPQPRRQLVQGKPPQPFPQPSDSRFPTSGVVPQHLMVKPLFEQQVRMLRSGK